ncbi:MAG: tetratricopeptide repeat protein [Candidatus Rifleibacteriota bacterium]
MSLVAENKILRFPLPVKFTTLFLFICLNIFLPRASVGQNNESFKTRMSVAQILADKGNFDAAIKKYRSIISHFSNNSSARAKLAKLLFWQGQLKEAEKIFSTLDFTKMAAQERKAFIELSIAQGNKTKAAELGQTHLKINPEDHSMMLKVSEVLSWISEYNKSLKFLSKLENINYKPARVALVRAQVLFWSGRHQKALNHFKELKAQGIESTDLYIIQGEFLMAIASFTEAISSFDKAKQFLHEANNKSLNYSSPDSPLYKIKKGKAFSNSALGNNDKAETLLKDLLQSNPEQTDIVIELNRVLRRNNKLAEAIKVLKEYETKAGKNQKILFELGDCHIETGYWHKTREYYTKADRIASFTPELELRWANRLAQIRNFPESEKIIKKHLKTNRNNLELKIELAWTKASMERYEEATGILKQILHNYPKNHQAMLTMAKVKMLEKKFDKAELLATLLKKKGTYKTEAQKLLREISSQRTPKKIDYKESRTSKIDELENQWHQDPENFRINFELVQELANQKDYDAALCLLNNVLSLYPGHYVASLMKARILGWAKYFSDSLCNYKRLSMRYPKNPVFYREAGRTAFWANKPDCANYWYGEMLTNPVSEMLYQRIESATSSSISAEKKLKNLLKKSGKEGFEKYEDFQNHFRSTRKELNASNSEFIEKNLLDLYSTYLLQRHFHLEYRGKFLNSQRKPRKALKAFNRLLETEPANLEVLFDISQIMCTLGLNDHERRIYDKILGYAPDHNLIRDALKKLDEDEKPMLKYKYYYQQEKGRGSLATMRIYGSQLVASAYLNKRWQASISGSSRYFRPGIWNGRFRSIETQLKLKGVLSAYTRLNAGLSHNKFASNHFPGQVTPSSTTTGFIDIFHSIQDNLNLNLGFSKKALYPNDIALRDGTTLETLYLGVKYPVSRKFVIGARLEDAKYSDANELNVLKYDARYDLTDFPEIFRLIFSGENRHTSNKSLYAYKNGNLIDIKYPYWTPQNYKGRGIALEYFRDLSKTRICRADKHYFSLIFSLGDESLSNHSRRIDWQWHLDWQNEWEAELSGHWHDSLDWKSERVDFYLGYRF